MNDLINRQAAIGAIDAQALTTYQNVKEGATYPKKEWFGGMANACEIIKALPSAEPAWIPCSERLPETPDDVLTTYIVNGNRKKRFVETATYYDGDEGFWSSPWDEYRVAGTRVEVIAWMPMPLPYEVEK